MAPAATTESPPPRHAADDGRARADPHIPLDDDGGGSYAGSATGWLQGMAREMARGTARCDQAHIRSSHRLIGDVDTSEIVERALLVDEHIAVDADVVAAGRVERRDQREAFVQRLALSAD